VLGILYPLDGKVVSPAGAPNAKPYKAATDLIVQLTCGNEVNSQLAQGCYEKWLSTAESWTRDLSIPCQKLYQLSHLAFMQWWSPRSHGLSLIGHIFLILQVSIQKIHYKYDRSIIFLEIISYLVSQHAEIVCDIPIGLVIYGRPSDFRFARSLGLYIGRLQKVYPVETNQV
jgi:hypothetical protein